MFLLQPLIPGGYFKPKDSTPEEVERARLAAVEGRRKLEEKYFTIKQSAGPDSSGPVERQSSVTDILKLIYMTVLPQTMLAFRGSYLVCKEVFFISRIARRQGT